MQLCDFLKKISICLCFLFTCQTVGAVGVVNGLQSLRQMYENEENFIHQVMASGNLWHLKYTMKTQILNPQKDKIETVTSNGELIAGKHIRYIKTGQMEMVVDDKDKYTILSAERKILHMQPTANDLEMGDNVYRAIIEDSTLKYYDLNRCTQVIDNGAATIRYDLVAKDARRCPYSTFSMFEDAKTHTFKKVIAILNPAISKSIKSYTFTVTERNELKASKEWQKAHNHIFNSAGQLKTPYKGYHYSEYKK